MDTIDTLSIAEIKLNFFDLMEEIVTTYGDDQDTSDETEQEEVQG